jgi:hypothetical protein
MGALCRKDNPNNSYTATPEPSWLRRLFYKCLMQREWSSTSIDRLTEAFCLLSVNEAAQAAISLAAWVAVGGRKTGSIRSRTPVKLP